MKALGSQIQKKQKYLRNFTEQGMNLLGKLKALDWGFIFAARSPGIIMPTFR
jgi:hypothetical protein